VNALMPRYPNPQLREEMISPAATCFYSDLMDYGVVDLFG
jgi:hypothetical protein